MEDNRGFALGVIGIIVLIALTVILSEGICFKDCRVYRGGIPQGLMVKYDLVEWNNDYRLYQAKDGRTHRIMQPQHRESQPSDDMPIKIGTMIL